MIMNSQKGDLAYHRPKFRLLDYDPETPHGRLLRPRMPFYAASNTVWQQESITLGILLQKENLQTSRKEEKQDDIYLGF